MLSQILSGCPSVTDSDVKINLSILCPFLRIVRLHKETACLVRARHKQAELIWVSDPLIARCISALRPRKLHAQVGTFLIKRQGVAVASLVLCTSTTLNKRTFIKYVVAGTLALVPSPLMNHNS